MYVEYVDRMANVCRLCTVQYNMFDVRLPCNGVTFYTYDTVLQIFDIHVCAEILRVEYDIVTGLNSECYKSFLLVVGGDTQNGRRLAFNMKYPRFYQHDEGNHPSNILHICILAHKV